MFLRAICIVKTGANAGNQDRGPAPSSHAGVNRSVPGVTRPPEYPDAPQIISTIPRVRGGPGVSPYMPLERLYVPTSPADIPRVSYGKILTPEEAGLLLRLHPKTVCRMARAKQIPAFRVGKHWRLRETDLFAWIDRQLLGSTGQPSECRS